MLASLYIILFGQPSNAELREDGTLSYVIS
jgi:hypothetical protein